VAGISTLDVIGSKGRLTELP